MSLRSYTCLLLLILNAKVNAQLHIYKENSISFDSLLVLKGNQSKGISFPLFKYSNHTRTIDNSSLKGKVTYINFWFKNCPPCIAEMNSLNELYNSLSSNGNFQFVSFTFEDQKTIDAMRLKYKIKYHIFSIPKADCYKLNQGNGFPTSIVVDQNGIIRFLLPGYNTDPKKAHEVLFEKIYPEITKLMK